MIAIESGNDLLSLGVMIRQRRLELGWTQVQLAVHAGVSQGSLSMFERSGTGMQLERVIAVLRAVGLLVLVDERSGYVEQKSA